MDWSMKGERDWMRGEVLDCGVLVCEVVLDCEMVYVLNQYSLLIPFLLIAVPSYSISLSLHPSSQTSPDPTQTPLRLLETMKLHRKQSPA